MRQLNCTLLNPDGSQVPAGTLVYTELVIDTDVNGPNYGGRVEEDGRLIFRFPDCAPEGQGGSVRVHAKGTEWAGRFVTPTAQPMTIDVTQDDGSVITWNVGPSTECPHHIVLQRSAHPGPFRRSGVVRAAGRCWFDDNGFFFPLGATLFWTARGWKFEQDRIRQNLKWLSDHRWDYVRMLGEVNWSGNEIDSTWTDYQAVIAGAVDACYDEYGMRVELTVWGGGSRDPLRATDLICEVVKGREHKFQHLEAVNEFFQNLPDAATVREMTKRLARTGVLCAPSSPNPVSEQAMFTLMQGAGTCATVHLDRGSGDLDWRFVRQPWDLKNLPWPTSNNEGKGPASSVSANSNPVQLAQYRVVSAVCGAGGFVLHSGAGIFGVRHIHQGTGTLRTANLWEMPDIEPVMTAVRGVDAMLPSGCENWRKANDGWKPPNQEHPLSAVDFWEGDRQGGRGVNKNYAAVDAPNRAFVTAPNGVKADRDGDVGGTFTATWPCRLKAYDTRTAELVTEATLNAGERFTLPGRRDSMQAYVVVGTLL